MDWLSVFEIPIKYLKLCGVWVEKNSSRKFSVYAFFANFINLFCIKGYLIFGTLYYLITNESSDIEDFAQSMNMLPTFIGDVLKISNLLHKTSKIEELMKSLKEIIEYENWIEENGGARLKARIRQIDSIFKAFMITSLTGVFFFCMIPFTTHELPLKLWFPYDHKSNEFLFWFSTSLMLLPAIFSGPITIISDTLPMFFLNFITGMLEELSERLSHISKVTKQDDEEYSKELVKCIKVLQKINALQVEVGEIFGTIIWAQGFISTLVLCTTSFSLTVVSEEILSNE